MSLAVIGFTAAAHVSIEVVRQDNAFQVEAKLMVAMHQRVAWQVLTDNDKLASFVPGMRSSRIVSAAGEPLVLEQKGIVAMAIADRRLVGAPATGTAVRHDDPRCQLFGQVSHGNGQMARQCCAVLA